MSTIKDVASLAGVSICTVSRALANKDYIKPETRKRVLEAAEQLQYKPNHVAQSLKTGKTNTLALMLPDITNMYYPIIAKHVEEYAAQRGYMILICNADMDLQKEMQLVELLKKRNVDGVIALPMSKSIAHIQTLAYQGIPYVFVNREFADDPHCIPSDNVYGGYTVAKHLIARGKRKICGIFQSFENPIYEDRCRGVKAALQEHGLGDSYFLYDVADMQDVHNRVEVFLGEEEYPDAFFVANDMLAAGVYSAAYHRKLEIPRDISVAGYDNIAYAPMMIPPLTTFEQPEEEMAREAVDYLISQIEDDAVPGKKFGKMRGRLVLRDSVA